MHAQDAGPVRRGRHLAEGGEELRLGCGDERRQEGGHAGLEEGVARVAVPVRIGGEEVDSGEPVDLQVDEARNRDAVAVRRRPAEAGDTAAEDDRAAGARDLESLAVDPSDAVVGVSASGTTPYVVGAIEAASKAGALTACVVAASASELGALVDHEIAVVVGPEFIAGSTRLKAGTAQKLVLNTISTISMIRLGKTYGNLMVDVVAANEKLQERVRRIVGAATRASSGEVDAALADADGNARVAIVTLLAGVDADTARARLDASDGSIARALEKAP